MEQNKLYPVFLKMDQFTTLIVGGGKVALEKLSFLLKSSPNAKIEMVASEYTKEVIELTKKFKISIVVKHYDITDLSGVGLVIAATNDSETNKQIKEDANHQNILVNVADTPVLCDFYLGGIVTKGNVKIAISTNGKSPTIAKRLRQFFEEVLPEELDDLVLNLNHFRKTVQGDFQKKVNTLNTLTAELLTKNQ